MSSTPSSCAVFTVTKAYLILTYQRHVCSNSCVRCVNMTFKRHECELARSEYIKNVWVVRRYQLKNTTSPPTPKAVNRSVRSEVTRGSILLLHGKLLKICACVSKLSMRRAIRQACSPHFFFFFKNVLKEKLGLRMFGVSSSMRYVYRGLA